MIMANMYAHVDGKGQLIAAFDVLSKEIQQGARKVVIKNAQAILANAFRRVPKKTGELASTLRYEVTVDDGLNTIATVMVGYGKIRRSGSGKRPRFKRGRKQAMMPAGDGSRGAYAPVVEFGSKKDGRQPRPFFFNSARIQRSTFIAEMKDLLTRSVQKAAA